MSKKLNCWVKIEIISYLKIVSYCFLFSFLVANCNNGDSNSKVAKDDSAVSPSASQPDPGPEVDWLQHWPPIKSNADPKDSLRIKKLIRIHVRGWLAEYNDSAEANFVVKKFNFVLRSLSPLTYTVNAFLKPPAKPAPGHLIPPEPDPPSDPE